MPVRSVYVPGLREAFGFNLIDIVLDHSTEPLRRGNTIRRNNNTCGAIYKSKYKMGMNKGSQKKIGEKEMEKESGGRAVDQTDMTCPEIFVKPTETKKSKSALSDDCSSKELSLRMTDSAGTSVKLQFHSKDQLNNVLQLLHSAGTASQRTTAPILFKSVTVKSLFSNSVTCLQATEISKFAILECCDVIANNVSVYTIPYCTVQYSTVQYFAVFCCGQVLVCLQLFSYKISVVLLVAYLHTSVCLHLIFVFLSVTVTYVCKY